MLLSCELVSDVVVVVDEVDDGALVEVEVEVDVEVELDDVALDDVSVEVVLVVGVESALEVAVNDDTVASVKPSRAARPIDSR